MAMQAQVGEATHDRIVGNILADVGLAPNDTAAAKEVEAGIDAMIGLIKV